MYNSKMLKAVVLGHAVGDALGVPVEFSSREQLDIKPVSDMLGFGIYPYPAGSWSDDTSMSLCALDRLAEDQCDLNLIMVNFGRWYYNNEFTSTGEMFDVGNTCSYAIDNYFAFQKPISECGLCEEEANGNGSLMRIHPFVLYLYAKDKALTKDGIDLIFRASAMTHAHIRSKIGCGIYAYVLMNMLEHPSIESVYQGLTKAKEVFEHESEFVYYSRIFDKNFAALPCNKIKSSGYIVDTLEASLWCLLTTSSYRECVLKAVNLGEDTDTVAAIAGSLAGALYGYHSIPDQWLKVLKRRDYIENMCDNAFEVWSKKYKKYSKYNRNEWIKTIEFSRENSDIIPLEKIEFFHVAQAGAMGEPGRVSLYYRQNGHLIHYHSTINSGFRVDHYRKSVMYLGMGNFLYTTLELYECLKNKTANMLPSEIYANLPEVIMEL